MPQGIQIFGADGSVYLDTTHGTMKMIEEVKIDPAVNGYSGTITVPEFVNEPNAFAIFDSNARRPNSMQYRDPIVTINTTAGTIDWYYEFQDSTAGLGYLVYGVL